MPSDRREQKLVEKALATGRLTQRQYLECMQAIASGEERGETKTISQVLEEKGVLTREDLEALDDRSLEGETLGGFRVEKKLGEGGMGAVFRATQLSLGRPVALKVLSPRYASDPDFVARFVREARAAARLDHPHVVKPLEIGEDRGFRFIAMEFCEGGSVASRLDEVGAFSEREALEVVLAVGRALEYAAELGLVHRDIKPDNILFERTGTVKLADLGLAKDRSEGADLTATGVIMGTPAYMSPEQALGEEELDVRSDIYALGIALFEMLTGRVPFKGSSPVVVLNRQVNDPLPDPRSLAPHLTDEVCALIARMTAKSRDERFAKPQDLVAAVQAILDRRRAVASEPTAPLPILRTPEPAVRATPGASSSLPTLPASPRAGLERPASPRPSRKREAVLLGVLAIAAAVFIARPDAARELTALLAKAGASPLRAPEDRTPAAPESATPATASAPAPATPSPDPAPAPATPSPGPAPAPATPSPDPAPETATLDPAPRAQTSSPEPAPRAQPPSPPSAPKPPPPPATTIAAARARVEPKLDRLFRAEVTALDADAYRIAYDFTGPRAPEFARDWRGAQGWRAWANGLGRPAEPLSSGRRRFAEVLGRPPLEMASPFTALRAVEWTVEHDGGPMLVLSVGPARFALLPREGRVVAWRGPGFTLDLEPRRIGQRPHFEAPDGAQDVRGAAVALPKGERDPIVLRITTAPGALGSPPSLILAVSGPRVLVLPLERLPATGDSIELWVPRGFFIRGAALEGVPDWVGLDARR